jgi:tetratricopeptide (TPR) repeat protein
MKKLTFILLFALSIMPAFAQSQSANIEKLDSLANKLFQEENFSKSLEIRQMHLDALKAKVGEKDSTYIFSLLQLGKCYYRTEQLDKAIETAQKVVDLYGQNVSTNNKKYAYMLDNLALYQGSKSLYAPALQNAEKALALYETFHENDNDMAAIQIHVAEIANGSGDHAKAILHELLALNIIRDYYGEHSKEYTDEAAYLQTYYEDNGDKAKAEELSKRIETLKKETEDGEVDLPNAVEFTSATVAHDHNRDVMRCIDYYLNHYLTADKINEASNYILKWSDVSNDSHVVIGKNEAKMMNDEKALPYYVAFIAGCSKYALENGKADFTLDTFENAMIDAINYYTSNKQFTGEVKYLEEYVKAYSKGRDKLNALLEKNFPGEMTTDMVRRIDNGEHVKIGK